MKQKEKSFNIRMSSIELDEIKKECNGIEENISDFIRKSIKLRISLLHMLEDLNYEIDHNKKEDIAKLIEVLENKLM